MLQQYQRLFDALPVASASNELRHSILKEIGILHLRSMRIKFFASSALLFTSCISLYFISASVAVQMGQSGFFDYASLALSDGGTMMTYWQEFSITLLESLPILGLTLTLLAVFTLLQSLRYAMKNSEAIFTHRYS